tara:strand:- start:2223 stop:2801 length:579 start_codon:yes stop_codon:yes gene_type:complete
MEPLQAILGASMGIGLAAASGFRVFLPPFLMSLWLRFGFLSLEIEGSEFDFIYSDLCVIMLGVASASEILAYKIPFLDNALDAIATPLAGLAGVAVMAVSLEGLDPSIQWGVAVIAGGGASLGIQSATVAGRGISSVLTLGIGNPLFSITEDIASLFLVLIALVAPLIALMMTLCLIVYFLKRNKNTVELKA